MNRQVWKAVVPVDDEWHTLSVGYKILHVDCQDPASVSLWFESAPLTNRKFKVVGTGHPIPDGSEHVGTALTASGRLVWHVYEEVPF